MFPVGLPFSQMFLRISILSQAHGSSEEFTHSHACLPTCLQAIEPAALIPLPLLKPNCKVTNKLCPFFLV